MPKSLYLYSFLLSLCLCRFAQAELTPVRLQLKWDHEFVLLASLFQRSPFSYTVLAGAPIKNLKDIYKSCIDNSGDFDVVNHF